MLSGLGGAVIGGAIALTTVFVGERLRTQRRIETERANIEGKLEGEKFYLRHVSYLSLHAQIHGQYLTHLEIISSYSPVPEQVLEGYRSEARFWRDQNNIRQTEQAAAIRSFQVLLVKVKHLYPSNEKIATLCDDLLRVEPPQPLEITNFSSTSEISKWRDGSLAFVIAYLDEAWVEPIDNLLALMRKASLSSEDDQMVTPELPLITFSRWIRKRARRLRSEVEADW